MHISYDVAGTTYVGRSCAAGRGRPPGVPGGGTSERWAAPDAGGASGTTLGGRRRTPSPPSASAVVWGTKRRRTGARGAALPRRRERRRRARSPSAASRGRARAESPTTATTRRRPPHGHDSTSEVNIRRNGSARSSRWCLDVITGGRARGGCTSLHARLSEGTPYSKTVSCISSKHRRYRQVVSPSGHGRGLRAVVLAEPVDRCDASTIASPHHLHICCRKCHFVSPCRISSIGRTRELSP